MIRNRFMRAWRGFSLIEAMTVVVILGLTVPGMTWSLQRAQEQRLAPVMASRARWLASERLEDVIADRHCTTRGYSYVVNASYPAEQAVSGFPAFARSVSILETGGDLSSSGTGYKKVTVTVSWQDRGVTQSLSLATVVTDFPQ